MMVIQFSIPVTRKNVIGWLLGILGVWAFIEYSWIISGIVVATVMLMAGGR
jgi:hypothetical protein